jgi:hypothetical protein
VYDYQKKFILTGKAENLRMLTYSQIVKIIKQNYEFEYIYESTICELIKHIKVKVNGKGIFPIKFFFINKHNLIKYSLQYLLHKEIFLILKKGLFKAYTDEKLTGLLLEKFNIKTSRRTVSRIRTELKIPVSKLRFIKIKKINLFNFTLFYELNLSNIKKTTPKYQGVYELYFTNLNMFYIGSSTNLFNRFRIHYYNSLKYKNETIYFRFYKTLEYQNIEKFIIEHYSKQKIRLMNRNNVINKIVCQSFKNQLYFSGIIEENISTGKMR